MSDNLPGCAVLGPGTMGAQIALSLALGGAKVSLWGRRAEALGPAIVRCAEGFEFLANQGLVHISNREKILARIQPEADLQKTVTGKNFIVEAVAEDMDIKQQLLSRAELYCSPDTVISSTTSALSASAIQSVLERPSNFCVAHYAQPAHLVKLVEVVPGEDSSEETIDFTIGLLNATGKTPVRCPDIPGFLWARIQHAVLREFASLVGQGLVTPEACDTILKQGYAVRLPAMGAFEHADLAGLDLMNGAAAKAVWADLSNVKDPAETPVGRLYSEGHTGMKSGSGFYDWKKLDPEEFKRNRDQEIVRRLKIQAGARVELA